MSVRAGKVEVRRARALRTMPQTEQAVAGGALSVEHVDVLAGANTEHRAARFADHEESLVEQCTQLRFADACRMIDYWKHHADADSTEDDAQRQQDSRTVSAVDHVRRDGRSAGPARPDWWRRVPRRADPVDGAVPVQDLATGTIRTATQRRADALVEMAHRSRSAAEGGLRPRPLLTILVGANTLAHLCELANGHVVAPGQLVPLLSEADIERIVFDGPDRVIRVSRKRRFTGALRRAIEVHDRRCQHPSGCDEPASRCDVDHITPHSHGGATSLDNGELKCWPHNRIDALRNSRPTEPAPPEELHDDRHDDEQTDRGPPSAA